MKLFLFFLCFLALPAFSAFQNPISLNDYQHIDVNNRVLFKINGKPISVMDVVHKMDLIFYRQYPHLTSSVMARYQFFTTAWKGMVESIIDDHLIMADAKEKEVVVSDGEVREEMESIFGPDVVVNLDKVGLKLSEAMELLKMEMTVQRMNIAMVRSKALMAATPKKMRALYEKKLEKNPPQERWTYNVISIRGEGHHDVANQACQLINEKKLSLEDVIKSFALSSVEISLSEDYTRKGSDIAVAHKAILQTLAMGACSAPVSQTNVTRIFVLKEHDIDKPDPLYKVADSLKKELVESISAEYFAAYRDKLREKYGMTKDYLKKLIPENFEPFVLTR